METHPIPQQISSYQFRLVGDMTLKQFFQIAAGALISLLFYATHLHPLIKWPIIFFFSLLGVALAFLPFNERPLEKWILAFFRSVYAPTIFGWKKLGIAPVFYQEETPTLQGNPVLPKKEDLSKAYLTTSPIKTTSIFSGLENAEQSFLAKLALLFTSGSPASGQTTINQKPETATAVVETLKETQVVQQGARPKLVVEENTPSSQTPGIQFSKVNPVFAGQESTTTESAQFSLDAAPPNPPSIPNTIVGQIMDMQGKIVESAILEIRDSAGRPVRALRSNKLGHFTVVTPLQNGRYDILTEKDGFFFKTVTFQAKGEIIPPIAIKGNLEPKLVVAEEPVVSQQMAANG